MKSKELIFTGSKPTAPKDFFELRIIAESLGLKIPLQAPFTPKDINDLIPLLRLSLDEGAIQESKSVETGLGYDTKGYAYMCHIDRANFVFGPTNWRWRVANELYEQVPTMGGYEKHVYSGEVILEIGYSELNPDKKQFEWITVHQVPPIPTDHEAVNRGDARKGMLTKGLKRATSFLGIGADAYIGSIDYDLLPPPMPETDLRTKSTPEDQKFINERTYSQVIGLAKTKGIMTDNKLREFYKTKSEGEITSEPCYLTSKEATQVKKYLMQLPDRKVEDDWDKPPKPESLPADDDVKEESSDKCEYVMPTSLAELMAADEWVIRSIAKEKMVQVPEVLTEKNKASICKMLGSLLGLK